MSVLPALSLAPEEEEEVLLSVLSVVVVVPVSEPVLSLLLLLLLSELEPVTEPSLPVQVGFFPYHCAAPAPLS